MPVSNVQVSTVRRQDPHPFSLFCSLRKSFLSIFLNRAISSVHHLFFIQVQHHALQALSPKAPCRQDFSHQKSFTLCSLEAPFLPCSSLRHTHVPLWFPDHGQQNHNQLSHMALVQGHCWAQPVPRQLREGAQAVPPLLHPGLTPPGVLGTAGGPAWPCHWLQGAVGWDAGAQHRGGWALLEFKCPLRSKAWSATHTFWKLQSHRIS